MSVITVYALRRLNTYEATGSYGSQTGTVDEVAIEQVDLSRRLAKLDERLQRVIRMTVEGYRQREIACACGLSTRGLARMLARVRAKLTVEDLRRLA